MGGWGGLCGAEWAGQVVWGGGRDHRVALRCRQECGVTWQCGAGRGSDPGARARRGPLVLHP